MKLIPILLLALLCCPSLGCSSPEDDGGAQGESQGGTVPRIDGERALSYVQKQVGFGPRPAGSQALVKTRDWFVEELKKLGLEPRIDSFEDKDNAPGMTFHNILCEIPGTTEPKDPSKQRILVLGSHYDTKLCAGHSNPAWNFRFVGANDAGSSSGLLLELARWFRDHPLRVPLLLIWFDGEESIEWHWNDDRALFGSKHAVRQLRKRFPKDRALFECIPVMYLLDMVGHKELAITRDTYSSKRLQEIVLKEATRLKKQRHFFKTETAVLDDHVPFHNFGIDVVNLIQFGPPTPEWWHTEKDTMDILSAKSLETIGKITAMALPRIVDEYYPPYESDSAEGKGDKKEGDK